VEEQPRQVFNDIDKVVKEVDKQPSVKYAQRLTPETSGDEHDALDFANKAKITRMIETLDTEESSTFPELDYFGQMHGTYLFAQGTDGLYIIDQHAAQERVKYEYYREKIGERSEEHTSELQSRFDLVCRLLLENKNKTKR